MKKYVIVLFIIALLAAGYWAQRADPLPKAVPAKSVEPVKTVKMAGGVEGHTYRNESLGFSVTLPDSWQITEGDFEAKVKQQGIDLGLQAPGFLPAAERTKLNKSLKTVTDLMIAFRATDAEKDSAIIRVSVEDLASLPQVKDAVDYFDLMRQMYRSMKLPTDFKYSETQAEKLGSKQFGFIDTSNKSGRKRIYATVKDRKAILFTLSYTSDADLQTFREILAQGNFRLK